MAKISKTIKKISGYRGSTFKTLIQKQQPITSARGFLERVIGKKRPKSDVHKLIIAAQKILFKQPKKGLKGRRKGDSTQKTIKSLYNYIRIGDSKKSLPSFTSSVSKPSTPTISNIPYRPLTRAEQVLWIKISPTGKQRLETAFSKDRKVYEMMLNGIINEMLLLHLELTAFATQSIIKHVPKDTGDLRNSLIASMNARTTKKPKKNTRRPSQLELRIGFFTDLPYVKYVDVPKRVINVRHHRNMGIISYRGGRHYLHDPTAKTKFMLTTREAVRTEARRLTKQLIRNLWINWKPVYTYPQIKAFFKYPGMRGI